MPPLSEVLDALTYAVLPAAAAAGVVFAAVAKLAPCRFAVAAGALALAAGFLAGNHFRGAVEFRLDPERRLTPAELGVALRDTFVPPTEEDAPLPPPARYWLPWTAALALVGGLVARALRPAAAWPVRVALAGLAAALAVSPDLRGTAPWLLPLLAAVILGEWAVLERVGQGAADGRLRLVPPAAMSLAFFGASVVLLHAHSARFADTATILLASLAAVAVAAWLLRADPSAAAPGAAVALPGLILAGHQDTSSAVPAASFALTAVAPLALGLLLLPAARTRPRTAIIGTAALLVSLLAAGVVLAARAESLSFE
ncbi:MAG TPA: hypothetical protein VF170_02320 [Planctomycetaceae bacterium]